MLKRFKGKVTDREIEGMFLSSVKMSGGIDFSYVAVFGKHDEAKMGFTFVLKPTRFFIGTMLFIWITGLVAFLIEMNRPETTSGIILISILFISSIQLLFYFSDMSAFKREVLKLFRNVEN